jgi:Flp pilus assembly protein TadB
VQFYDDEVNGNIIIIIIITMALAVVVVVVVVVEAAAAVLLVVVVVVVVVVVGVTPRAAARNVRALHAAVASGNLKRKNLRTGLESLGEADRFSGAI